MININITKREKVIIDPNTGARIERLPRPGEPMIIKEKKNELNNK
jgi:hypothetical protein